MIVNCMDQCEGWHVLGVMADYGTEFGGSCWLMLPPAQIQFLLIRHWNKITGIGWSWSGIEKKSGRTQESKWQIKCRTYTRPFKEAGLHPVTFYFHLICGVAQKRGCLERRHGRSTDHHYSRDAGFVLQYRERLSLVGFPLSPLWMESYCLSRGRRTHWLPGCRSYSGQCSVLHLP